VPFGTWSRKDVVPRLRQAFPTPLGKIRSKTKRSHSKHLELQLTLQYFL
jgi:hypothetical protein